MRVWVARAQPGAAATAARLLALGHEPIVAPLLEVRPIPGARLDLSGAAALAFTSANAVAAFERLSEVRDLPVFAVGDATAAAAREAGFAEVRSADGDVEALARLIASAADRLDGPVLHPSAREPAGDLAGALAGAGVVVRSVPVYATEAVEAQVPPAAEAVLVHSPKAARILAGLGARDLPAYVISEACAAPLRAVGMPVAVASSPREDALLALLP